MCSFSFSVFCGQWLPPPRRLQVATTAVGSCNISISINNINNRQSATPSAGRTFGLHFLLAQITLDVILLPPSVCLSVCLSVRHSVCDLPLPLSFSLLFSCLAVDHLSSFYGAHVLCPRFTSCLTFNSRPSPEKQQQQQQQQLQQQHQRTLLPSLAQTEPSLRFINRT